MVAAAACAGLLAYRSRAAESETAPILGVVRETEIHIAPETTGRLASVLVSAGQKVRKGDILAVLSAPELTASVQEAKAAAAQAVADRANVDAGPRHEEVDISAQNVAIAEANLALAQQQYARASALAAKDFASKQRLDEDTASLRKTEASLEALRAAYSRAKAGPTAEERASAAAKVALANAATDDLEAKLAKATLRSPVDGVVDLLVAAPGEIIAPGQSIMTLASGGERWFTFTVREDRLGPIAINAPVRLRMAGGSEIEGRVTELRPLGEFATWRAARAVGDHDLNSFLVRVDPVSANEDLQPGMTVWLEGASH